MTSVDLVGKLFRETEKIAWTKLTQKMTRLRIMILKIDFDILASKYEFNGVHEFRFLTEQSKLNLLVQSC